MIKKISFPIILSSALIFLLGVMVAIVPLEKVHASPIGSRVTCDIHVSVNGGSVTISGTVTEHHPEQDAGYTSIFLSDSTGHSADSSGDASASTSYTGQFSNGAYTAYIEGSGATSAGGSNCSDSQNFTVNGGETNLACFINSFSADNTSLANNTGTTLRFSLTKGGVGSLPWSIGLLQGGVASSPASGTISDNTFNGTSSTGNLAGTQVYRLTCGNATSDVTVGVASPVVINVANVCADSSAINYGGALPCTYYVPPPVGKITGYLPACSSGPYTVSISYTGAAGWMRISPSSSFIWPNYTFNNQPSNPQAYPNGSFVNAFLNLNPDTTYYAQIEVAGVLSPIFPFNVPSVCPNGGWSGWTSWSSCSASSCGQTGTQTATRSCSNPYPGPGGADCSGLDGGNFTQTQNCSTSACPVDGFWSDWSPCSVYCGGGTQTRTCTPPSNGGNDPCSDSSSRSCNTQACPAPTATLTVNGSSSGSITIPYNTPAYVGWSGDNVSECWVYKDGVRLGWGPETYHAENVSTGNLTESHTYQTRCTGTYGSANSSIVTVNVGPAPVDCAGGWGACSNGSQTYSITRYAANGGNACPSSNGATQACGTNGGWSGWSPASCPTGCGQSASTLTRTCTNPTPANGGAPCSGSSTQSCSATEACPVVVDGGWSGWSPASCPTACGQSASTLTRTCTNPTPANGGAPCSGSSTQSCSATAACTVPLDGGWSAWGSCSAACGGGTQTRTCTNPTPANGGAECVGLSSQGCNAQSCAVMSGTLTPSPSSCTIASGASSCSVDLSWTTSAPEATSAVTSSYPSANTTVFTGNSGDPSVTIPYGGRTFYLYNNAKLLGQATVPASCTSGTAWNGSSCATVFYPVDGGWSAWGSCSAACGGGTQTRTCTNPAPVNGGIGCSGDSSQSCNPGVCGSGGLSLNAGSTTIISGESTMLTWSGGSGSCTGTNFNNSGASSGTSSIALSGAVTIAPAITTTYTMTCIDNSIQFSTHVKVVVKKKPIYKEN